MKTPTREGEEDVYHLSATKKNFVTLIVLQLTKRVH